MKDRIILHIDMDYFFAQIEERENPQFKGKPVVVGADPKEGKGRGVVSTCNYLARKYGIHSAMPISKAYELCPKAIFLPVNMELYQKVSENIMEIIKKYSPPPLLLKNRFGQANYTKSGGGWEIVSLDEAYLDISFLENYQKAEKLAKELKKEILGEEKLTSTIGLGQNKLIAKMASAKAKPNGLLIIKPGQVKKFLEPLDIEDLQGIGPKTAEKLRAIEINKIWELKKLKKNALKKMFGIVGETIFERARGVDETPVISEEVIKSIGKEHTFEKDTRDPEIIFKTFDRIVEDVHRELLANKFSFKTITVICRFQGFETHTKSETLKDSTNSLGILKKEAKKLLLKFLIENQKLIRLIGLRVKII